MADRTFDTPTWRLLLDSAQALTAAGRAPFSRVELIRHAQGVDPDRTRASFDPIIQGMTDNASGGPPSACGKVLHRVRRGVYELLPGAAASAAQEAPGEAAGKKLLGRLPAADTTTRHRYGRPVARRSGTHCAYCGRDLAGSYEAWLDLSIDHVVPRRTIDERGFPAEWVEDLANLATCCRACDEFLDQYLVTDPAPASGEDFLALVETHLGLKRRLTLERHAEERDRYARWLKELRN